MAEYKATWESVKNHPIPTWFEDAKLGVFLHWGLYSVPAWAPRTEGVDVLLREEGPGGMFQTNPYSEWYANSYRVEGSPTYRYHRREYGSKPYESFREDFEAQSRDADLGQLAEAVKQTGAQYVVLTTKHHDGYTLWPSKLRHPHLGNFASQRDLVGDFAIASRKAGLKFGTYYSGGYDWPFNGAVLRGTSDAALAVPADPAYARYAEGHLQELVDNYGPSILWNDIGWPGGGDLAASFAHFYNTVPDGVVNDRWSLGPAHRSRFADLSTRVIAGLMTKFWAFMPQSFKKLRFPEGPHSDFVTPEYHSFAEIQDKPWELTRGIGRSFALNKNEGPEDFLTADDLVRSLADATSKNGRMLLGLGPDASGVIPEAQMRPARALGDWLRKNGEAIHGTRPYSRAEGTQSDVRYTVKGDSLYAIVFEPAGSPVVLDVVPAGQTVDMLGGVELHAEEQRGKLVVRLPEDLEPSSAYVIKVTGRNVEPQPAV